SDASSKLTNRNANIAANRSSFTKLPSNFRRYVIRRDTGLIEHLAEDARIDVNLSDIAHLLGSALHELCERVRRPRTQLRFACKLRQLGESPQLFLRAATSNIVAREARKRAIGHGDRARLDSRPDDRRDERLICSLGTLTQEFDERLVRVQHHPVVDVLQQRRRLLLRDLLRELVQDDLVERRAALEIFEQHADRQHLSQQLEASLTDR